MDTFSGDHKQDIMEWLDEYEEQTSVLKWDDVEKLIYARRLLRGKGKLYVSHGPRRPRIQWRLCRNRRR